VVSRSTSPLATAPTWTALQSASANTVNKWPAPENLCDWYPNLSNCGGTGSSWQSQGKFGGVPFVLWPGLDDTVAVVSTCGTANTADQDVCITVSRNRGQNFTQSLILSTRNDDGFGTRDNIDPASVHASVAQLPEASGPMTGDFSLPIYVVWRVFPTVTGGPVSWYFTRVVVGVDGTVAQTTPPEPIGVIADDPTLPFTRNRIAVFGTSVGADERVYIAFSEHSTPAPANCTAASSTPTPAPDTTSSVTWYVSESRNYGDTWECFQGSSSPGCFANSVSARTRIDTDSTYQDCVGPERTIPIGQPNGLRRTRSVNDSRPAVGIHAAAETLYADAFTSGQYWYFALGKSLSGKQRIHLYRGGGGAGVPVSDTAFEIKLVTTSPTDSTLVDSWAPNLTVMQRTEFADPHRGALVWRNGFASTFATTGLNWVFNPTAVSSTLTALTGVSGFAPTSPFENTIGPTTAIASYPRCSNSTAALAGCPNALLALWPNIPWFTAWLDNSPTGLNHQGQTLGFRL
jgi:hypothetical protein